jgi:hypothetical protein
MLCQTESLRRFSIYANCIVVVKNRGGHTRIYKASMKMTARMVI